MFLYGAGFGFTLNTYIGSHHDMGDTFRGDLVSKEALLKICGPGWTTATADAVTRLDTPFAITGSGGDKNRFSGKVAFGLGWRFASSVASTALGANMFITNYDFPFLNGSEYALTLFAWGANTLFPTINGLLIGYGIHSHHGFRAKGKFISGWKYFWNELMHPYTGAK